MGFFRAYFNNTSNILVVVLDIEILAESFGQPLVKSNQLLSNRALNFHCFALSLCIVSKIVSAIFNMSFKRFTGRAVGLQYRHARQDLKGNKWET